MAILLRVLALCAVIWLAAPDARGQCLVTETVLPSGRLKHSAAEETGTIRVKQNYDEAYWCSWHVTSSASWLQLISPVGAQFATATSNISYRVTANPSALPRTGQFTISATQTPPPSFQIVERTYTVDVVQDGTSPAKCPFSVDPPQAAFDTKQMTDLILRVFTDAFCEWKAQSTVPWVTVSVAKNLGPGNLYYSVAENSTGGTRSGTITLTLLDRDTSGNVPAPVVIPITQSAGPFKYQTPANGTLAYTTGGGADLQSGSGVMTSTSYTLSSLGAKVYDPTPSGLAIFGNRARDILVSEASVPATKLLFDGRVLAEMHDHVRTGLALSNPAAGSVTVTLTYTDENGRDVRQGSLTLPPHGQIAAFLDDKPFNGPVPFTGTLTFRSSTGVAAIALRGLTNERSEFLITTLPVSNLAAASIRSRYFAHFAESDVWSSQIVLINPTDGTLSGTLSILPPSGTSTINISYAIAPRSTWRTRPQGFSSGWVQVTPTIRTIAPDGVVLFSYREQGVTISEAGVQLSQVTATSDLEQQLYVETSGSLTDFYSHVPGSMQTGFALANLTTEAASVSLQLRGLDGSPVATATLTIPPKGQTAQFIGELTSRQALRTGGFLTRSFAEILGASFKGSLTITGAVAVTGLRFRSNERHEYVYTTLPPVDHTFDASNTDLYFAHIADGGGYTTQFILIGADAARSGEIHFYSKTGALLILPVTISP